MANVKTELALQIESIYGTRYKCLRVVAEEAFGPCNAESVEVVESGGLQKLSASHAHLEVPLVNHHNTVLFSGNQSSGQCFMLRRFPLYFVL